MKTASITIRISETEKEKLSQIAKERDIPVSQLIRESLKGVLKDASTELVSSND